MIEDGDRKTALEILQFVQAMPSLKTWHEERLAAGRRRRNIPQQGRTQAPGRERDATLGKAHAPAQEK
jgi:hypothetical protein